MKYFDDELFIFQGKFNLQLRNNEYIELCSFRVIVFSI